MKFILIAAILLLAVAPYKNMFVSADVAEIDKMFDDITSLAEHATDKLTDTFKTGLDDFSTAIIADRFIPKEKADEIQNKLKKNIDDCIDKGKLDIFILSIKAKRALRDTQNQLNKALRKVPTIHKARADLIKTMADIHDIVHKTGMCTTSNIFKSSEAIKNYRHQKHQAESSTIGSVTSITIAT